MSTTPLQSTSRLGLSRERILDAALDLLDREGLSGFSMRRLGEELGVGVMTIYGYFRGKEELLDALVDTGGSVIAEKLRAVPQDGSWHTQMRSLMIAIHQTLLEHPAVVELRYKRPLLSPGALSLTEIGMQILLDAGFAKRDAAHIYRTLFVYTFGWAAFGPRPGSEADTERSFEAIGALSADQYPALVGAAREASETMAEQTVFERGLDALLDGFDHRVSRLPQT